MNQNTRCDCQKAGDKDPRAIPILLARKHHTMGVLEGARIKGERHDYKSAQKET